MERFRQILKRIFCLPPLPTVFIAVPSFALVIFVLTTEHEGALAYVSYVMSAYSLIISVTGLSYIDDFVKTIQTGIDSHPLVEKLINIPLGARFLKDVKFRTEVSLYLGFFINLLYIVMKMASGISYHSVWFISVAVYYTLLAFMRFLLFRRGKARRDGDHLEEEFKRYRLCGIMLLLMNQALAGIVAFMVHKNQSYDYPGLLIYAMATYSFYLVIIAVKNVIQFRKHKSPVLSAAKVINLVSAMVSILSLETAMVARFGNADDFSSRQTITGATGGGVCTFVLGMAIFMIVKSSKELKKLNVNTSQT